MKSCTDAMPRVSIQRQIAALEARRAEIYAGASGRRLSDTERAQVHDLTRALAAAWELRRFEQAQQPPVEHELTIVYTGGR